MTWTEFWHAQPATLYSRSFFREILYTSFKKTPKSASKSSKSWWLGRKSSPATEISRNKNIHCMQLIIDTCNNLLWYSIVSRYTQCSQKYLQGFYYTHHFTSMGWGGCWGIYDFQISRRALSYRWCDILWSSPAVLLPLCWMPVFYMCYCAINYLP